MLISNFSSGELSENLNGRIDLPQYYQAASRLENFDVIPTGGIKRRCGLERLAMLNGNCRLIPFILDKDTSFILEFVPGRIYIWRNGEKVTTTGGTQLYITTSYESIAEINEIHYAQDFNKLIFVHAEYAPFMLEYSFSDETFTGGNMNFDFYANVELDDDYNYVVIAGTDFPERVTRADDKLAFYDKDGNVIVTGEKGYCVYNGKLYEYSRDNSQWEVYGEDPDVDYDLFSEENKYPSCVTFFNNRMWFASTKDARQKVWASATPDTDGTRYNDFCTYQKFVTVNKVVKDADVHIFTGNILLTNIDTANNTTTITDVTQDLSASGVLAEDVTAYFCTNNTYVPVGTKVLSVTSNSVTLDKALSATVTEDVRSIVFTIQLWRNIESISADDYEMQITSSNITTSDCSFNFELASDQNDAIKFIAANKYLTVGTESSIWNIPASVTALSISAEMAGRYGSSEIQGHAVGTAMCFFAQGKYGIRETYFNNDEQAFQTNNIALGAEQMLTESPAVDFDFCVNPYNRIVIVRDDGKTVCMLYDKNNGVMAWYRMTHGNSALRFESCAIVRGSRQSDIMYFSVKDGNNYYLERYDENASVYLDSFQTFSQEALSDYDENAVIFNVTTGEIVPVSEVSNMTIGETDVVYIGYKYASVISSMPIVSNDPTGKRRITSLLVRFLQSYMPEMTCEESTEFFTDVEEPFSGIKGIDFAGNSDRDVKFTLTTEKPYPCRILSINAQTA